MNHKLTVFVFFSIIITMQAIVGAANESNEAVTNKILSPVDPDILSIYCPILFCQHPDINGISISPLDPGTNKINISVYGELTKICSEDRFLWAVHRNGNTFFIELVHFSTSEICILVMSPFSITIPIDVSGLTKGDYIIDVNGIGEGFYLETDVPIEPVPEIPTIALTAVGLFGLFFIKRFFRQQ